MRTEAPLLAPIFRSEGQARLLAALLIPGEELSISDLAKAAAVPYGSAHREVERLIEAGILRDRTVGRTRLVSEDPESPLTRPLREILLISTGPVALLSEELAKIGGVERAFIYGSYAARASGERGAVPRDIDVMVIGSPDIGEVYAASARVERQVGRPVNPTVLSAREAEEDSGFLDHVRESPTLPLVGRTS